MQTTYIFRSILAALTVVALAACDNSSSQPEKAASATQTEPVAASSVSNASDADQDLLKQAQAIFKPLPSVEEARAEHPFTDAQVQLGKQLWYDPRLSKSDKISCNSCHSLDNYGVDGHSTSTGHNGALGGRNAPTSLNSGTLGIQFWDGRAPNVEEQAKGPLVNPVEMAMPNLDVVAKKVASIDGYNKSFKEVYADKGGEATIDNIAHAIGAFERTLLTPSRWDKYLRGDINALSVPERVGLQTFIDKGCVACHSGMGLGGDTFQKFGLVKGPYWKYIDAKNHNIGIADITKKEEDQNFFRVASLRNVAKTAPYFHTGTVKDLHEAVRVMGEIQLGKTLSSEEIDNIVVFLNALTGEVPADALNVPTLPEK